MKESEFVAMLENNIEGTLANHFGSDGVVKALAQRCANNAAALLAIVEIEERCPLCGLNMPGDMDAQALYIAIAESMKKTADTRISVKEMAKVESNAIYSVLDELARNTAQAVISFLFAQQRKTAQQNADFRNEKEGSNHEE